MAETNNNVPLLHRKEWQTMTPAPTTTAAGAFTINDNNNLKRYIMYVASATVHYLYDHENDDWIQIASGALGGTFGAGACGCYSDWSATYTATGGSTTTIEVNAAAFNIHGIVLGREVEFLSGTAGNIGLRRTVTAIKHPGTATGTITITLDEAVTAVANNDTFRVTSGTFFVFMPGTLSATSFKKYDLATGVWTACSVTNLPATWGTDGRMVNLGCFDTSFDSGTASSGSATTLVDSTKAWADNQWINYQVRITGGTGQGQIRTITDSNATTLTFATGATIDETSTYVIEGDENAIYLIGNNAVTMYKYSISGNSWATVSPTTARGGAAAIGAGMEYVGKTGDSVWADITDIKDGRYIYSLRGGASAVLDRFNISGGTNGAGAWEVMAYTPYITTFTTGTSTDWLGQWIYIAKEGSATVPQRFFKYNLIENVMKPLATDWYLNGASLLGNRLWCRYLSSEKKIFWVYNLGSTSTNLRRIMIF